MANKFLSFLEAAGKDFQKGLALVVGYLPEVSGLAGIIFPAAAAPLTAATVAANLIQNAVVAVEQKYAAAGVQNGTGVQKLADVTALVGQAVTTLLAEPQVTEALSKEGITVDSTYVNGLINAVVSILNVKGSAAVTAAVKS